MARQWMNPSMTARIWDQKNDRHIEPREVTSIQPGNDLLEAGKVIEIREAPKVEDSKEPIFLSSSLQIEESDEER